MSADKNHFGHRLYPPRQTHRASRPHDLRTIEYQFRTNPEIHLGTFGLDQFNGLGSCNRRPTHRSEGFAQFSVCENIARHVFNTLVFFELHYRACCEDRDPGAGLLETYKVATPLAFTRSTDRSKLVSSMPKALLRKRNFLAADLASRFFGETGTWLPPRMFRRYPLLV